MPLHDLETPHLRKYRAWYASESGTNGTLINGFQAITMSGGTATAIAFAGGSRTDRLHRVRWVTAAPAGSLVSLRNAPLHYALSDGFEVHYRFRISDPADVTGARMFLGIRAATGALTNVDPATLTNVAGIGHNSGDTTLRIYGAEGTAGTPVDLGAGFPALGSFAGFFDFSVVGLGGDGAFWRAVAWDDAVASGPSASASGQFARCPSASAAITAFIAFRTNNATALAVALDLAAIQISTL